MNWHGAICTDYSIVTECFATSLSIILSQINSILYSIIPWVWTQLNFVHRYMRYFTGMFIGMPILIKAHQQRTLSNFRIFFFWFSVQSVKNWKRTSFDTEIELPLTTLDHGTSCQGHVSYLNESRFTRVLNGWNPCLSRWVRSRNHR